MGMQPSSLRSAVDTVGAVIANAARATPNRVAANINQVDYSFAELHAHGDRAAHRLIKAGGKHGDLVLLLADTSFEMLGLFVGAARAGMVFAPLNPGLDPATISSLIGKLKPGLIIADPHHAHLVAGVAVPVLSTHAGAEPAIDDGVDQTRPEVTGSDGHVIFFTSGSTGLPKAALLSHATSVLRSHPGSQLEPRGPALCPYPLFHMAGWTVTMQQWHARASVIFVDGTEPAVLADALRRYEIERFNTIPALWTRIAEHLGADGAGAFPSLRFADTGTSPTSIELLDTICRMAPTAKVRVFYGSTETGNTTSLDHDDLGAKPGSCGQPSIMMETAFGDSGELLARGPLLFDGYLGDPVSGFDADGWFHTGDLARADEEGFLYITGRAGTEIRTGGEAVSPDRVEAAILTHPDIDAVTVFGLPDEQWGEVVWAAVVCARPVSLDELVAHLGPDGPDPLARHQRPRFVLPLDEIPKTAATGKPDRPALRALAARFSS